MKFIYNQFNYPCPFEWNEIPKDVNYLTIEIGDGCKSENEGIDIIGHISYPWCASVDGQIAWFSKEDYSVKFLIQKRGKETQFIIDVFKGLEDCEFECGNIIEFGKCIWKRPEPSIFYIFNK